jgi:hypothetical protein
VIGNANFFNEKWLRTYTKPNFDRINRMQRMFLDLYTGFYPENHVHPVCLG